MLAHVTIYLGLNYDEFVWRKVRYEFGGELETDLGRFNKEVTRLPSTINGIDCRKEFFKKAESYLKVLTSRQRGV